MKKTIDNIEQPDRVWYYLLDFNDRDNWNTIFKNFDHEQLHRLNHNQFWSLFNIAVKNDVEKFGSLK